MTTSHLLPNEAKEPPHRPARSKSRRRNWSKFHKFLKHPLFLAIVAFLFTGILAAQYQDRLSKNAKDRDLLISKRQKTSEAVKTITDILFERVFRGNMLASSINRHAQQTEIIERKKSYDEVYVRYNSTIQSNLFRLREMFNTTQYTAFELAMESGLRDLLATQDSCLTVAFDSAVSMDDAQRKGATDILNHCKPALDISRKKVSTPTEISFSDIYKSLIHCEYTFSDTLFETVEGDEVPSYETSQVAEIVDQACSFPNAITEVTK